MKHECKCTTIERSRVGAHGEHESGRMVDGTIVEAVELHEGGCVVAIHTNDSPIPVLFQLTRGDAIFLADLLLRRSL